MLTNLRRYLKQKTWFYIHFPNPYKNDDVDTCKRTRGGTFEDKRSSFKLPLPPPPHTHTQNDDVNSRFESEEVPLTFNDVISPCGSYSVIVNFPRFSPCFTNQS